MTFIIDHGAYSLKIGNSIDSEYKIYQNCTVKSKYSKGINYISNEYEKILDKTSISFTYPFQRGYLVNWNNQKEIWDFLFNNDEPKFNIKDNSLIITESVYNFESITDGFIEVFFEDYQINRMYITNALQMAFQNYCVAKNAIPNETCALIVNSGFSFTHVTPIVNGKIYTNAVIRIDVGGKLLTNYLKEAISYRQLNILNEPYIANQIKEDVCRVSLDFKKELISSSKNPEFYQLPDFRTIQRGILTWSLPPAESNLENQILSLRTEQITIPEILFHPSIVGINQIGISQAISQSINLTPYGLHYIVKVQAIDIQPHLYSNIVLTGGNFYFPDIKTRIYNDLRSSTYDYLNLDITLPDDPVIYPWKGGVQMSKNLEDSDYVSNSRYQEEGTSRVREYFTNANYYEKNSINIPVK